MEYNLEFDGTTVLCCVCGDKSSGFHYGVHSCEGCKGFFRRSIQQKIQYRPCTKNQQCLILRINRNRCQYCRLKKCIQVGMSRDAVRFGRVPKREKAKILAAMQSKNQSNQDKLLTEQLMDEQAMLNAIFDAHNETCDFTHEKMAPIFLKAEQNPIYADYPSQMTCPLNPLSAPASPDSTQINDSFSPAIRGVVQFARRLPGFSSLPNEDQVTLLKAGVFEALLVRLAVLFRSSEKMYCLNGQILRRSDAVDSSQNGRFLFECTFEFGERVNSLGLSDQDIALFSAVVLVTPDRPGIRNVELVKKIHQKLDQLLMNQMATNHPEEPNLYTELKKKIPDLRTLNTLHSEKLLAVKMDNGNHNTDGVVSTSSGSSSSTPNYSYAEYYSTNSFKCNQSVASDWSDFGSPRSVGSSCDNESTSTKAMDMCPYSPCEQIAQFHLSNQTVNGRITNNNSVSSPGSTSSNSSAGQIHSSSHRTSSLSNFSSSSNHSYNGALALHSSTVASVCPVASSSNNDNNSINSATLTERPSTVINKPRFGQLSCYNNNNLISSATQQSTDEEKLAGLINRRVDSPTDSGIESVKEGNSDTSVCSSPRSDSEDQQLHNNTANNQTSQTTIKNQKQSTTNSSSVINNSNNSSNNNNINNNNNNNNNNNSSIDDMPMLKRALQAPPLLNTTSLLMDEAYRHHKKFRATKIQQAQRELEAQSPQSSTHQSTHDELLQQSNNQSLASSHSTLVKTLQQQSRFANEQHLKRTDLIHNIIMRGNEADLISSSKPSTFGLLDNSPHSTSNNNNLTNQCRSSIIHTATSNNQSTLQQLLAPNKPSSNSIYGSTFGSAPSPLKYHNSNLNTQHHISSVGISPPSPANSLVNNSPPPGLLTHPSSIFHYSQSTQHHLYHPIHPAHQNHHSSSNALLEAQPLDLSNSKKSSSPITPPISPKVEMN